MSLIATVMEYWHAGLCPIPLKSYSKLPTITCAEVKKMYHLPDRATIERWFDAPDVGIGLVCGIGGLRVIDIEERYEWARFWHIVRMLGNGVCGMTKGDDYGDWDEDE